MTRLDHDGRRAEIVLARARVFLTLASCAAIYLDPTEPSHFVPVAYALLAAYTAGSAWLLFALGVQSRLPRWAPSAVHAADILWMAVLTSATGASSSPLFPFFTFVVLAAAYRWGFVETLATTVVLSLVLCAQALATVAFPALAEAFGREFQLNRFLVRSAYMLIGGVLLAYLAASEKQLRREASAVAQLLSRIRSETGLFRALDAAARDLMDIFGVQSLAIAVRERGEGRAVVWLLSRTDASGLRRVRAGRDERQQYFFEAPSAFALARGRDGLRLTVALDSFGGEVSLGDGRIASGPTAAFSTALAASIAFQDEWTARVFLFDPRRGMRGARALRLLQRIAAGTAPALQSAYLAGRLRVRAEAAERERLARELHDTSIQSLIGLEMEMVALSRRTPDPTLRQEVGKIQSRLRAEIQSLRRLMDSLHPRAAAPPSLTDRLAAALARFEVDTGIRARFLSGAALAVPPALEHELVQIVQAALSNVRRHSTATRVDVTLERDGDGWRLLIEDDGSGFVSGGRLGGREAPVAPRTMRERVRALGGQLTSEPRDVAGVRIEIRLPPLTVPA